MFSLYISKKDINLIKLCDKEAFSIIKVNDKINIRFNDIVHFESCKKKISNSLTDTKITEFNKFSHQQN
jgi:hypothetical protein